MALFRHGSREYNLVQLKVQVFEDERRNEALMIEGE
jgi:hypothetical protein